MLKGKGRSECIPLLFIGSSKGVFKHRSSAGSRLFVLDFDEIVSGRLHINLIAPLTLTSPVSINVPTTSALILITKDSFCYTRYIREYQKAEKWKRA